MNDYTYWVLIGTDSLYRLSFCTWCEAEAAKGTLDPFAFVCPVPNETIGYKAIDWLNAQARS